MVSMSEVLFVLRRWWWRCTLLGIPLAVGAFAAVWFSFVPQYEATALLMVDDSQRGLDGTYISPSGFSETQLAIMRSDITLSKVAGRTDVAAMKDTPTGSTLEWVRAGLSVRYVGQSQLCQITFKARDKETAAKVANAVLQEYLDTYRVDRNAETESMIRELKVESKNRLDETERLRKKVLALMGQGTGKTPIIYQGRDLTMPATPLTNWETQLTAAELDKIMEKAKLDAYQQGMAEETFEVSAEEIDQLLEAQPTVQALKSELSKLKVVQNQHAQALPKGPRHPDVQKAHDKLVNDVKTAEELLRTTKAEMRSKLEEHLKGEKKAKTEQFLKEQEAKIARIQISIDVLAGKIEAERDQLTKMAGGTQEVEFAKSELARAEKVYDGIQNQLTQLSLAKWPEPIMKHTAVAPDNPIEAYPLKKCGMFSLGAFLLPFGLAFGWEKILRRITSAEQLLSEVSLPVLGEVTTLPTRWMLPGRRSSERFLRDRITFEESIESLRLGLTLAPDLKDMQVVVVTSAVSQEGKTSVATALAVSVARCTQDMTLLIDSDMRAPNAHEMFDISLGPGLAEVLEGTSTLDDAIAVKGLGVHVLPAGELKVNPHVAMKDGAFVKLLAELRGKYRYVIIDAPPVLAASEALLVASAADGTLVCTMRDRSRMAQLSTACQRLTHAGARLVGAVISGVPTRDWAQKYGSYGYGWDRYSEAQTRWNSAPPETPREIIVETAAPNESNSES
jgi:capsular exopolysaccharide synthesis family protein